MVNREMSAKSSNYRKLSIMFLFLVMLTFLEVGLIMGFSWSDLEAYWSFDETSGALIEDISQNEYDGSLLNGDVGRVTGCRNVGCFNATLNQVPVNTTNSTGGIITDFNRDMSISFWMYQERYISFIKMLAIGDSTGTTNRSQVWFQPAVSDKIWIQYNSTQYLTSSQGYSLNRIGYWELVTITYDDTTKNISLYINGTIDNSTIAYTGVTSTAGNYSIGGQTNGLNNFTGLIDEYFIISRTLTASEVSELWNNGDGIFYSNIGSYVIVNETYNTSTYETASETFDIIVEYNISNYTDIKAVFWYNNTNITSALAGDNTGLDANETLFTTTIDISLTNSTITNSFWWEIILVNSTGSQFKENSTTHSQSVEPLIMTFCNSTYNVDFLNFTFEDEESGNVANGTFAVTFQYSIFGGDLVKSYSFENATENSEYSFCMSPPQFDYTVDMEAQYSGSIYDTRTYYLDNATITNASSSVTLYLFNASNSVNFFIDVKNQLAPFTDALITIAKYFVGEGVYKTISIRETDENGEFIEYLDLDESYRFYINRDGVSYGFIDRTAVCTEAPCEMTLEIGDPSFDLWEGYGDVFGRNVLYNLSYNDTSKIVTFDFVDTTGLADYFRLLVQRFRGNQTAESICDTTLYSSSGSITCNVTGTEGDFKATGFVSRSPELVVAFIHFINSIIKDTLGLEGILFALLIIITVAMVGVWSPSVAVMLVAFAVLMMKIMGFVAFGYTTVILIFVLAVILIIKLKV